MAIGSDSDMTGEQGDEADASSYVGYVYVATNPAMPGLVKIGSDYGRTAALCGSSESLGRD